MQAEAVYALVRKDKVSKWPDKSNVSRLAPECWPSLKSKFKMHAGDTVFTIGSCFARNVEEHLASMGFKVPMLDLVVPKTETSGRPSGIMNKYTPPSVLWELDWASRLWAREEIDVEALSESLLSLGDGRWVDLQLAHFKPVTYERAVERRREILKLFFRCFDADVVTITLGLIESWWDAEKEMHIQQAPTVEMVEMWPGRFHFDMLDYVRSYEFLRKAVEILLSVGNKDKKILLTTSPVPLGRTFSGMDVIVANNYAKSVLRAVAGKVSLENDAVDYFSSYESAVLSDRDLVWEDDQIHVKDGFVGKIVDHLVQDFVDVDVKVVKGVVDFVDSGVVKGWAFMPSNADDPLDVHVVHRGRDYVVRADLMRAGLQQRGIHSTGRCGFECRLEGVAQVVRRSDINVFVMTPNKVELPFRPGLESQ